jgi:hypothetical protein
MKKADKFLFKCFIFSIMFFGISYSFFEDPFDEMSDFFNIKDEMNRHFKDMQLKINEQKSFLKNSTCLEGINCSVNSQPIGVSFNHNEDQNEYTLSLNLPNNVSHEDIHTTFIDDEVAQILVSKEGFQLKIRLTASGYSVNAAAGSNVKNKEGTARASSSQQINQSSSLPNNIDIEEISISFNQKNNELIIHMPILKKNKKSRQEIPIDLI